MIHELAHNWGWIALRGVLAVLFGILCFAWPGSAFAALVLLFGAYAFVDGVFALIALFRGAGKDRFWMLVLEAVVGIGVGILTIAHPPEGDHRRVLARAGRRAVDRLRGAALRRDRAGGAGPDLVDRRLRAPLRDHPARARLPAAEVPHRAHPSRSHAPAGLSRRAFTPRVSESSTRAS